MRGQSQTYHPRGQAKEINIPLLALNPRKFGSDQIPVADCLIDDEDTPERSRSAHKQKLVILGTGWAVSTSSLATITDA
jgi:NADH:quinone reductase (non-electrogenic)